MQARDRQTSRQGKGVCRMWIGVGGGGRQTETDRQTDKQIDRQAGRQETERDRQADRQAGHRKRDRQVTQKQNQTGRQRDYVKVSGGDKENEASRHGRTGGWVAGVGVGGGGGGKKEKVINERQTSKQTYRLRVRSSHSNI